MDYKASGVDIDAGNEVVRRIRSLARGTFTSGVLSDIGSFGGLFHLDAARAADAVLVASADGVGTKLRVAFMAGTHRSIGVDLVNHCVNDILVQGAEPLFFLDYLATGRLDPDVAVQIVEGLADGLQAERLRAARRRDGGDARLLQGRRVRRRRVHRRHRLARATDRRQPRSSRGRPDRIAVVWTAHQRLLTGPPDCIRRRRARCSIPLSGLDHVDRRGAARLRIVRTCR